MLRTIDEDLGQRVATGLAIELPPANKPVRNPLDLDTSDALSIQKRWTPTLKGRKIAILFAEGSPLDRIEALKAAVEAAGGTAYTVAPKVGGIRVKGGVLKADGQLAGSPSVLFDAVALILTADAASALAKDAAAVAFVMDAFGHLKAIGHDGGAKPLLDRAGITPEDGVCSLDDLPKAGTKRYWDREPSVRQLA